MAGEKLSLRVLTPTRTVLEAEVDSVTLRSVEGDKGILVNHEPYTAKLETGPLRAYIGRELTHDLYVLGGTAMVQDNRVTVLTGTAGSREDVETDLRQLQDQLAARREEELRSQTDIHRAEMALRSLLVQTDVSSYTVISEQGKNDEQS